MSHTDRLAEVITALSARDDRLTMRFGTVASANTIDFGDGVAVEVASWAVAAPTVGKRAVAIINRGLVLGIGLA